MLNQILFEKKEMDKLIRIEHTLQKATILCEKLLPALKQNSSSILEFVYLLKNQKENVLKYFVKEFNQEKHGQIEALRIMNSHLNSNDVDYLLENAESFFLSTITELNLAANSGLNNSCITKLFNNIHSSTLNTTHTNFQNLVILNLKNNKLLTDQIFNDIGHLEAVRELNLNNTSVSDAGLHILVKSKLFENLETLILSRNHQMITLEAFTTEEAKKIKKLKHLDLSFTKIIPKGLDNFKKIPFIQFLEVLDLSDNREMIEESELAKLYKLTNNEDQAISFNLKRLYLKNIRLTTPLFNVWFTNNFPHLEYLDLEGNENLFTDVNKEDDLKQRFILNQLTSLSIRKTGLSNKSGMIVMKELQSIKHLDISQNELVDEEGIREIIKLLDENNIKLISLGLATLALHKIISVIFEKHQKVIQTLQHLYFRENGHNLYQDQNNENLQIKASSAQTNVENENGEKSNNIVSALINVEGMKLKYLNLSACNITDEQYLQLLNHPTLLQDLEDLRLSENNEIYHDTVLQNLVAHLKNLTHLRRISLGSSYSLDTEIPQEIISSKIQIQPFFCDDLD